MNSGTAAVISRTSGALLFSRVKLGRHRRFIRSDVLDALDGLRRQTS